MFNENSNQPDQDSELSPENIPEPKLAQPKPSPSTSSGPSEEPVQENESSGKDWHKSLIGILIIVSIALTLSYVVYSLYLTPSPINPNQNLAADIIQEKVKVPEVEASRFANFEEDKIDVVASLEPYQVEAGFANVENQADFDHLSSEVKAKLAQNNFVVTTNFSKEFFSSYNSNASSYTPSFITTDSLLHTYHLYFNYLLKSLEQEKLIPTARSLTGQLVAKSEEQYQALKGTAWENAAKRNMAYFWVANILLGAPTENIPETVVGEVAGEIEKIIAHEGLALSDVMNIGVATPDPRTAYMEDYSQYVPRGHYNKSAGLQNYFKTMMWYGRLNFRVRSEDETRSAILSTLSLSDDQIYANWEKLYEPITFFVGRADDLTIYDYENVLKEVYGEEVSLADLDDAEKLAQFIEEVEKLDPPAINSMPVFSDDKTVEERDKAIKGWRLLGQRFTIDAAIFQRLICPEVGNKDGSMVCPQGDSRMLPKGLDITAAMGSQEAENILNELGEKDYANYPENLAKLQEYIAELKEETWSENLYWGWLYTLKTLLIEKLKGWPSFMTNQAWARKDLNTYLASWTELKHDTILYAKQAYAGVGMAAPEEKDDRGYAEPNPELYNRLASLLRMTVEGLEARGLLSEENKQNLNRLELLAVSLRDISLKELKGEILSDEEYAFIRGYGSVLTDLWLATFSEAEKSETDMRTLLDENPAALVADVATDPNGQVLEEAIGWINTIYVVVPVDGKLRITRGGVFSHYEFPWPLADRLTNEKWREMLKEKSEELPKAEEWKKVFLVE